MILVLDKVTKRSAQLYSISTAVLWGYDYLLTVGDEVGIYKLQEGREEADHPMQVRYAWKLESVPSAQTLTLSTRPL